jgi:hypothetical protein
MPGEHSVRQEEQPQVEREGNHQAGYPKDDPRNAHRVQSGRRSGQTRCGQPDQPQADGHAEEPCLVGQTAAWRPFAEHLADGVAPRSDDAGPGPQQPRQTDHPRPGPDLLDRGQVLPHHRTEAGDRPGHGVPQLGF